MQIALQYNNDPLASFLANKLKFTPVKFAMFTVISLVIALLAIAFATKTVTGSADTYLQNWVLWVWLFLASPVLSIYYLWIPNVMVSITRYLQGSQVVEIKDEEVSKMQNYYRHPWRVYISILGAVVISWIFYITRSGLGGWSGSGPFQKVVSTLVIFVGGYMASMVVINILLNIWSIRLLLQNKTFQLNPLHPDKSGGLGILSQYSLRTAYLAGVAGILVGISEYRVIALGLTRSYWFVHPFVPLYIFWAVFSFLGPLYVAHIEMKRLKEEKLKTIADQFQKENEEMQRNLSADAETIKQRLEKMKSLKEYVDPPAFSVSILT